MNEPRNFSELIYGLIDIVNTTIPVVASLAFLAFLWGLVKFISRVSGDEKAVSDGKNLMKWGLVALFVMVCIGGILEFVSNDFGFSFGLPLLPE